MTHSAVVQSRAEDNGRNIERQLSRKQCCRVPPCCDQQCGFALLFVLSIIRCSHTCVVHLHRCKRPIKPGYLWSILTGCWPVALPGSSCQQPPSASRPTPVYRAAAAAAGVGWASHAVGLVLLRLLRSGLLWQRVLAGLAHEPSSSGAVCAHTCRAGHLWPQQWLRGREGKDGVQ